MADKITHEQFEDLRRATSTSEFHKMLARYTGIDAIPYTAYQYFDGAGNYVGDSNDSGLLDLLKSAYIEVVDDGK